MVSESNAITAGFVGLLVGLLILLAGVFLGGELVIIAVGGVIAVASVSGFVFAAFQDESHAAHEG